MSTYTDGANISHVLNFVWSLHKSLFSMVIPVRSNNSSWYSLQSLRDTQAPPTNVKVTALGGVTKEISAMYSYISLGLNQLLNVGVDQWLQMAV